MHEVKAFLCGYFTRCYQADFGMMEEQGWVRRQPSKEQISGLKRVYYREFVDFCFADALSQVEEILLFLIFWKYLWKS